MNKLTLRINENPYALDKVFELHASLAMSYAIRDEALEELGHRTVLAKMLKTLLRDLVQQFEEQVSIMEKEKLCTK